MEAGKVQAAGALAAVIAVEIDLFKVDHTVVIKVLLLKKRGQRKL